MPAVAGVWVNSGVGLGVMVGVVNAVGVGAPDVANWAHWVMISWAFAWETVSSMTVCCNACEMGNASLQ
jgi:hypothetical protein